jgi:hypothetical protein
MAAAAAAVGCSLLVPLDYTGGTPPTRPSRGGQGGTGATETGGFAGEGVGGTLGDAGTGDSGGPGEPEGGAGNASEVGGTGGMEYGTGGDTTAGTAGSAGSSATGGMGGTGNIGGSPSAGTDATGGMDTGGFGGIVSAGMGGTGGMTGGRGGRFGGGRGGMGMGGMQGGMSGSGVAGNADCPGVDVSTDHDNCGMCGHACGADQDCADGVCISSPCDGVCATWIMADSTSDGMRKTNLGTTKDTCVQVNSYEPQAGYLPAFNCWGTSARTMSVNGTVMTCDSASRALNVEKRKGGYCVHATMGADDWAGFVFPYTDNCCHAPP